MNSKTLAQIGGLITAVFSAIGGISAGIYIFEMICKKLPKFEVFLTFLGILVPVFIIGVAELLFFDLFFNTANRKQRTKSFYKSEKKVKK